MAEEVQQVIGVSSVVSDGDGRILLIRTAKAGWELPGGRVESGENFIAALRREIREETGCEVEVGRLTGVTTDVKAGVTIFTFLCRHAAGDPHPGDDSLDVGWFDRDAAANLISHPAEQARLKDALDDGQGVVYRAYQSVPGDGQRRETFETILLHRC